MATQTGDTFYADANGENLSKDKTGKILEFTVLDMSKLELSVSAASISITGSVNVPGTIQDGENTFTVTTIAEYGFGLCEHIEEITFPDTIRVIGNSAFYGDNNLKSLIFNSNVVLNHSQYMLSDYNNITIYVPEDLVDDYKNSSSWSFCSSIIKPIQKRISDILPNDFPLTQETGWINTTDANKTVFLDEDDLSFADSNDEYSISLDVSSFLENADENIYSYVSGDNTYTFTLNNSVLSSITLNSTDASDQKFNGSYEKLFPVNVIADENGTISPSYSSNVQDETSYTINENTLTINETTITATPDEGFAFDCWKVGDAEISSNGTITARTTFTATFKEITYLVKVIAGENGCISPVFSNEITINTTYSINENKLTIGDEIIVAAPNKNYEFDCWKVDGTEVSTNGTITKDVTFTATFRIIERPNDPVPQNENNDGLSNGAVAGISVAASVVGSLLITYSVLFIVWLKNGKDFKFLSKTFESLSKLFKK